MSSLPSSADRKRDTLPAKKDPRDLVRVTITWAGEGRWEVVREHASNGDRTICSDLADALRHVLRAYDADGHAR